MHSLAVSNTSCLLEVSLISLITSPVWFSKINSNGIEDQLLH